MIKDSNWRPLPNFLTIKQSSIEGLGLFSTKDIIKGTDLGITHVFDKRFHDNYLRLPLGAFINHHEIPNCKAVFGEEDENLGKVKHIRIVAINNIRILFFIKIKIFYCFYFPKINYSYASII